MKLVFDNYPRITSGSHIFCAHCGMSDTYIRGKLNGHLADCPYRMEKIKELQAKQPPKATPIDKDGKRIPSEKKPKKDKKPSRIIMLRGLPASGKSTEAACLVAENPNLVRINRDDFRKMLRFKPVLPGRMEDLVTQLEDDAVELALYNDYDVVVDACNLGNRSETRWKNIAVRHNAELVIQDLGVSVESCVKQDDTRSLGQVGRTVIENMALRYNKLTPYDGPVVIFDIDGTLADNSARVCYSKGPDKDWEKYHELAWADNPRKVVINWANACARAGIKVVLVSGRPSSLNGDLTHYWLKLHNVMYSYLFMRGRDDFRDDTIVKQQILDKMLQWIKKEQILFAVDDRQRIVDMWRRNGIKCYPVADGDPNF